VRRDRSRLEAVALAIATVAVVAPARVVAGEACYEHHFLGDHPDEANPGYHVETQGLAHDPDNWFISQNVGACVVPLDHPLCLLPNVPDGCLVPAALCDLAGVGSTCDFRRQGLLWKWPVTEDLDGGNAAAIATTSASVCAAGFDHLGAPGYFAFEGTGFVLAPLEGNGPAVVAFSSDPVEIAWSPLDPAAGQSSASWVAVDAAGFLWMGNHGESHVNRYSVDWGALRDQGQLVIAFVDQVPLLDESGNALALDSWEQGGAFSEGVALPYPLLYLVNGNADDDCDCGIHVFEVRDAATGAPCGPTPGSCAARRVDRSTNGSGQFNYAYDPGFSTYEEPEGLTFWDLDADSRAPNVSGQVHVVMLDNDASEALQGDDDVYVKHYRLETDTVPPVVACPPDVVVECTGNDGILANDPQLQPFFAGATATDQCDDAVAIGSDSPAFLPLGVTVVTFTATDDFGNAASCAASVTVHDTVAPVVTVSLDPAVLWPPDHRLVPIGATVAVSDVCDPSPTFVLASIASDEPDDGAGDGHTSPDVEDAQLGTADTSFLLRAERDGSGDGRVYTVAYTASDGSGNTSGATGATLVPHGR
jgi:hypothetical protein